MISRKIIRMPKPTSNAKPTKKKKQDVLKNKIEAILAIIGIFIILNIFYPDYFGTLYGHLDFYFSAFLVTAIVLFEQGDAQLGIMCLVIQIAAWLAFLFLLKVTVFDMYFPKIRIITPTKDFYVIARKVAQGKGDDPRFIYFMVKFHLRPIFSWHKLKIPKPEAYYKGIPGFNRREIKVKTGTAGVRWRRMPASLDILTDTLHINFNEKELVYELGLKADNYRPDPVEPYSQSTFDGVQQVGTNIIESVKGDYGLIKGQFNMGIVIRERKLPGTEIPKKPETEEQKKPTIEEEDGNRIS